MLIARHPHTAVSYLLRNRSYESVHARLKEILSVEEAAFFAGTERRSTERLWYGDGYSASKSFSALSEDDKNEVSDLVASFKNSILPKVLADRELSNIAQELFIIPSEDSIVVAQAANGGLKVCITQWACRSALGDHNSDPLAIVVERPKPNHTPVKVWAVYSDGSPFAKGSVFFYYKDRMNTLKTDAEGKVNLGMLRNGTAFYLTNQAEQDQGENQAITVIPGQEEYKVVFPFFTSITIQVLDQKGRAVPGVQISSGYDGQSMSHLSNSEGKAYLPQLLYTTSAFKLVETDNEANTQEYTLPRSEAETITFLVNRLDYTQAKVKVLNQHGEIMPDYPFFLKTPTLTERYQTNQEGEKMIDPLQVGQEIIIEDVYNVENREVYTPVEGSNEIILRVEVKPPQMVQFKVINHKNEALPGVELRFATASGELQHLTDAHGTCQLAQNTFTHGSKIPVKILVLSGKSRNKTYRRKIRYSNSQLEYILKLRNYRWLWWLLMLLLPLLLLIQCEKTVYVKTVDAQSQAPVSNADIHFDYRQAFLYDQGRFFTNDFREFNQKSNDQGLVEFSHLKYSIYSLIFKNLSPATLFAHSGCYTSDTLRPRFHYLRSRDTLRLNLHPGFVPFDFQVIDSLDAQVLPDAQVDVIAELNGIQYTDSGVTGPDGRVVFTKIPHCSQIVKVVARAEGFHPDSLLNKSLRDLLNGPVEQNRLLKLSPQLGSFSFFVIDCKSKKPIANADFTIELDYDGRKNKKTKPANINGVGKGYAKDYLIARIHISGKAPFYKPGELEGWHLVREFTDSTKYPAAKRTFCLEPEENCVEFTNTDERTGKPLAGVTNLVSIQNGSDTRKATVISTGAGTFTVCSIRVGDKISIVSQYPPDYEDNTNSIQNKDGIDLLKAPPAQRTIPLKPKEVELTFRTVNDASGELIPDADLNVYFDGVPQPAPTSSGNGAFTIKVPITAQISIEAAKAGFGSNSSKINNTAVKAILPPVPQTERDIPLVEEVTPCDQPITSSEGYSEIGFQLGSKDYPFELTYDMDSHPDQLTIYCGEGTNGQVLFSELLLEDHGSPIMINFNARQCKGYITVVIEPLGGDSRSVWEYTISCPDN